jgi:hypothetical protein
MCDAIADTQRWRRLYRDAEKREMYLAGRRLQKKKSRSDPESVMSVGERLYRQLNADRERLRVKDWRGRNRIGFLSQQAAYQRTRICTDVGYRLRRTLRTRLRIALKRNLAGGSAIRDCGCSIEFLKTYIERQFHDGMTWDNWGNLWHLDHRRALGLFDLTNRNELLRACHYTNLQPMFIADHRRKTAADRKQILESRVRPPGDLSVVERMAAE